MITGKTDIDKEYLFRIHLALKFIDGNLDSDLSLEKVADKAFYSPFHFHRLFKAIVGETLNQYINRRRIEQSALILINHRKINICELSIKYGFNSHSAFTRAFKNYYGLSPLEFLKQRPGKYSKISQTESKNRQESYVFEQYICNIDHHLNWIKMNANIEIKVLPEMNFAAITHIGEKGLGDAFNRLIKWANPKEMLENKSSKVGRIFHDSFRVTSPDKVRMSVCLLTKEPFDEEGEIVAMTIDGGRFIEGHFEISMHEFESAWSGLFIWMNENGYQKADGNPFELYHNDFRTHPEKKSIVDFYIPIK